MDGYELAHKMVDPLTEIGASSTALAVLKASSSV